MTFDQAQSPRLGQRTPIESTIVRMFSGAELPEMSWTGQMIWRTDTKILQVYNGTAYEDVAAGNAGSLTFVGPTVPVAQSAGDIWYKTDEGDSNNHPYRASVAGADEIAAGEWESVRDLPELDPERLVAGRLGQTLTLGASLKTATTGSRVELGPGGVWVYDTTGNTQTVLGSDGQSMFRGDAEVEGITIKGGASLRSPNSELSRGGKVTLQDGVTASATPPSVEVTWHNVQLQGMTTYSDEHVTGMPAIVSGNYYVSTYSSTYSVNKLLQFDANGNYVATKFTIGGTQQRLAYLNSTTVVAVNALDSVTYNVTVWNIANNPATQTYGGNITKRQNDWQPSVGRVTDTQFYVAERRSLDGRLNYRVFDVGVGGTTITYNSELDVGTGWPSLRIDGVYVGTADTGVARTYMNITKHTTNPDNEFVRAFNHTTDNSSDDNYHFPQPDTDVRGMAWDGANFWTLGTDWRVYRHEGGGNNWTNTYSSSQTTTGWCAFTWEDIVGPALHETPMSTVKKFTMKRRASIKVTTPAINNTGGADDPNAVGIYMARTTTTTPAPARTAMAYQSTSGTNVATVNAMSLSLARIPPDPANNPKAFPTTVTPGEVQSSGLDGTSSPLISLKGNGAARIGNLSVAPVTGALTFAAGPLRVLRAGSVTTGNTDVNGDVTVTHNLNRTDYLVLITCRGHSNVRIYHVMSHNANNFVARQFNHSNVVQATSSLNFNWFLIGD